MKKRLFLTFPQKILGEPLIYTLGKDYDVIPNIQGATITAEQGIMALELEGAPQAIEAAVDFLRSKEVKVDTMMPEEMQG